MTEADGVKQQIELIETDLDTVVNSFQALTPILDNMISNVLHLELDRANINGTMGIKMLEHIKDSLEHLTHQSFVFRNELRDYKYDV